MVSPAVVVDPRAERAVERMTVPIAGLTTPRGTAAAGSPPSSAPTDRVPDGLARSRRRRRRSTTSGASTSISPCRSPSSPRRGTARPPACCSVRLDLHPRPPRGHVLPRPVRDLAHRGRRLVRRPPRSRRTARRRPRAARTPRARSASSVSSTVSIAIETLSASSTSSATSGLVSSGSGSHSPTYSSRRRASVRSRLRACRVTIRTRYARGSRTSRLRRHRSRPPQPGLLDDVLGVGGGAEHLVGDREEQAAVGDERVVGSCRRRYARPLAPAA